MLPLKTSSKAALKDAVVNFIALLGKIPGVNKIFLLRNLLRNLISWNLKVTAYLRPNKTSRLSMLNISDVCLLRILQKYITLYIKQTVKRDDIDFKMLAHQFYSQEPNFSQTFRNRSTSLTLSLNMTLLCTATRK